MRAGRFWILSAILAATLLGLYGARRTAPTDGGDGDCLRGLSLPFKDWTSREQTLTAHERDLLQPDTVLLRQYRSRSGSEEIGIAVIAGHRKQTVHTPAFCMAGGGWNTLLENDVTILPGSGRIEAVRAVMESEGHRILVTYFFTDGARSRRSLTTFQAEQLWERLRGTAPSGALVRLITPIGADRSRAERLSDAFAAAVLPAVLKRMREARPAHR